MAHGAWSAALALVAALAGSAGSVAVGAAELSAQEIVERNVAARGGLEAWRKVERMTWIGHLEGEHAPMGASPFVLHQARPNLTHFEVKAIGRPTLRVFDGLHGWKARPGKTEVPEVRAYTPQETLYASHAPGLQGPLIDYQARGSTVDLEEIDTIDAQRVYRLRVVLASGEIDRVWIDAATFLDVRYDRPSYGPKGANQTVSVFYRDYQDFEGLKLPSRIETAAASGQSPDRMTIERVAINPRLDRYAFAEPGLRARHAPLARGPSDATMARRPAAAVTASPPPPAEGRAASLSAPSSEPQ